MNKIPEQKKRKDLSLRTKEGSAVIEMVGIVMVMIPVALLALNIAFLALGSFYNDAACREAARAACQQSSSDSAEAAANNALKNYQLAGNLLGSPQISSFKFNYRNTAAEPLVPSNLSMPIEIQSIKAEDNLSLADGAGDAAKGGNAPNVEVEMTMNCAVPAPFLIGQNGLTDSIALKSRYVFPLFAGLDDTSDDSDDSGESDDPPPAPDDPEAEVDADPEA
ncbi:MAG: hypothetical protein K2X27_28435 [Candidatus Obscuribacterales bacterium]|nr:hypothetical protein [Candidatus Obscuribacterales bacterium]